MILPENISKLQDIKDDLIYKIKEVDINLSNRNVVDNQSNRMKNHTYHAWKNRRLKEKLNLEKNLIFVKRKIKEVREKDLQDIIGIDKNDPESLLKALYNLIKQIIREENLVLDKEEYTLLNLIQSRF